MLSIDKCNKYSFFLLVCYASRVEEKLMNAILKDYNEKARPILKETDVVKVFIDIALPQLMKVVGIVYYFYNEFVTFGKHRCSILHFSLNEKYFKLGKINFSKNFCDCYKRQGKYWPIADQHVPSNYPNWKNGCKGIFGFNSLLIFDVAN